MTKNLETGAGAHRIQDIESAIKEAVAFLPKNFTPRHEHSKRCYRVLQHILYSNEYTVIEARQSNVKSISPTRIVATNQRIIVVNPSFWSVWTGHNLLTPTRYEVIPYNNVSNITLLTGLFFSSISIYLTTGTQNWDGAVVGLKTSDAKAMFIFLEKMTEALRKQEKQPATTHVQNSRKTNNNVNLNVAKELVRYKGSKFIWLGTQPVEYAAKMLNMDKNLIVKIGMEEIVKMVGEDVRELEGCILVYYDDHFAHHISDYIGEAHGVSLYVLDGGVEYYGDGKKAGDLPFKNSAKPA